MKYIRGNIMMQNLSCAAIWILLSKKYLVAEPVQNGFALGPTTYPQTGIGTENAYESNN